MIKDFFQRLSYLFLRFLVFLLSLVPFDAALGLADGIGLVVYYVWVSRRKIALDNIRKAFREKTEDEIVTIAKESFQNFARVIVEFIKIPSVFHELDKRAVKYGEDIAQRVFNGPKAVILLVSHLGNWEIVASFAWYVKRPTHAFGKPFRNPYIYNYVKRVRSIAGMFNLDAVKGIQDAIHALRRKEIVGMLIDQNAGARGIAVEFFGRPAMTSSLPASLAYKYDCVLLPVFCIREGRGHFRLYAKEPVPVSRTGNKEKDIYETTRRINAMMEDEIRKYPSQWLWMHKRWKWKPSYAPEVRKDAWILEKDLSHPEARN